MRWSFNGAKVAETYANLQRAEQLRGQFEQTQRLNGRRVDLEEERLAQSKAEYAQKQEAAARQREFYARVYGAQPNGSLPGMVNPVNPGLTMPMPGLNGSPPGMVNPVNPAPPAGFNPVNTATLMEPGAPPSNGLPPVYDPSMSPEARAAAEAYHNGQSTANYGVVEGDQDPALTAKWAETGGQPRPEHAAGLQGGAPPPSAPTQTGGNAFANHELKVARGVRDVMGQAFGAGVKMSKSQAEVIVRSRMGPAPAKPTKASGLSKLAEQLARQTDYLTMKRGEADAKNMSESTVTMYEGVQAAAIKSLGQLQNLESLGNRLAGMDTGKGFVTRAQISAWAEGLNSAGLLPDSLRDKVNSIVDINKGEVVSQQAAGAAINQMLVAMIGNTGNGEGGMPANNFSNKDLQFLIDALPGLNKLPGANKLIIDVMKLHQMRNIYKLQWMKTKLAANPKMDGFDLASGWTDFVVSKEGDDAMNAYEMERSQGMLNFRDTYRKVQELAGQVAPPPVGTPSEVTKRAGSLLDRM